MWTGVKYLTCLWLLGYLCLHISSTSRAAAASSYSSTSRAAAFLLLLPENLWHTPCGCSGSGFHDGVVLLFQRSLFIAATHADVTQTHTSCLSVDPTCPSETTATGSSTCHRPTTSVRRGLLLLLRTGLCHRFSVPSWDGFLLVFKQTEQHVVKILLCTRAPSSGESHCLHPVFLVSSIWGIVLLWRGKHSFQNLFFRKRMSMSRKHFLLASVNLLQKVTYTTQ